MKPLLYSVLLAVGLFMGAYWTTWSARSGEVSKTKMEQIMSLVQRAYVDSLDFEKVEESGIKSLLSSFDPHSVYIPANMVVAANQDLKGGFDGIGLEFLVASDTPVVVRVLKDGPAQLSGLLSGDRLLRADTFTLTGLQNDDIIATLKGKKGSEVALLVYRKSNEKTFELKITRAAIKQPTVSGFRLNNQTAYISILHFSEPTHQEFLSLIKSLQATGPLTQIVLDLRNNPGGYLQTSIALLDEFVDDNVLLAYTEGKNGKRKNYTAKKGGTCINMDLVCLVNHYSASASEIFSGAIQDLDRGLILGAPTYGKGLVQETFQLNDGAQIRLTIARYYIPSGRSIQKPYDANGYVDLLDSNRKQDAKAKTFTTANGRAVVSNGGIIPDVLMEDALEIGISRQNVSAVAIAIIDAHFAELAVIANQQWMTNKHINAVIDKYAAGHDSSFKREVKYRLAYQILGDEAYNSLRIPEDPWVLKAINSFGTISGILSGSR